MSIFPWRHLRNLTPSQSNAEKMTTNSSIRGQIYILSLNLHRDFSKGFSKETCLQWELNPQHGPSLD